MDDVTKKNILINCNTLPINSLLKIVNSGEISVQEFIDAELDLVTVKDLENRLTGSKIKEDGEGFKKKLLSKITNNQIAIDNFIDQVNDGSITEDDLLNCGLSEKTIRSIRFYGGKGRGVTIFKKIGDLPPMAKNRTDVYFVGLPGTGKSTMLSGLLYAAHKDGMLLPDTYNNDGSIYQTQIISDLTKGVLPRATASGSYNYIAMSLADEDKKKHPFNVVEVPGELYKSVFENNNINELLSYIKNDNKKILIFTIDSLSHDNGYFDDDALDQSLVYLNILNIFKNNGILNQTDAIYLVANKFDSIKQSRYSFDERSDAELALDFLNEEFKSLMNNCFAAREEIKNKFKIRVLPFSIGEVAFTSILKSYRIDYSQELIDKIIEDSFVMTKENFSIFKSK